MTPVICRVSEATVVMCCGLLKPRPSNIAAHVGRKQQKETSMPRSSGDPTRNERELTRVLKDLFEAVIKADVAALERLLHEDYVHHRPSGTVESRAQYLENRKARRVAFESLVADQINIRVYGDTAIVTGRSTAKGKDQRGKMNDQRRWIRVLVRQRGRWQFVHFHATPTPKPRRSRPARS